MNTIHCQITKEDNRIMKFEVVMNNQTIATYWSMPKETEEAFMSRIDLDVKLIYKVFNAAI